jgi:branched-chain amino acid transport system ATP-binding protein
VSRLEVADLSRQFGGVRAVDQLSFGLAPGQVHSIIGPNGAGKTTLFNLITGILPPSAGRIRLDGRDVTGLPPEALARLGVSRTFQNLRIFTNMSVRENVMVGRHLHLDRSFVKALVRAPSIRRAERAAMAHADALLERVGLASWREAMADQLPYGALKRLEIARALAAEPRLLLLDEPAAGCNATETREIDLLLKRVNAEGVTVVLVEHDMRMVMSISDHIVVLDHGRLLAEGTAAEIRKNPAVIEAYLGHGAIEAGDAARG